MTLLQPGTKAKFSSCITNLFQKLTLGITLKSTQPSQTKTLEQFKEILRQLQHEVSSKILHDEVSSKNLTEVILAIQNWSKNNLKKLSPNYVADAFVSVVEKEWDRDK